MHPGDALAHMRRRRAVLGQALGQFGEQRDRRVDLAALAPEVIEQVEIQVKYAGYIQRDLELIAGVKKNEELRIPASTDYEKISGLSNEIRVKLLETRPETIGQASRLMGVTPAAVANLLIHLKMTESAKSSSLEKSL